MPSVKRAQGQLLKSGYLPEVQSQDFERWLHSGFSAASISFYKREGDGSQVTDTFKVESPATDRPEFDEINSYYTHSITSAIRVAKVFGASKKHVT